jgi:predicted negative regulator of RcsB-dependent stress response
MALDLEEQEQLDEAKVWWKQHGNKVIWGVTIFLLAVAGWRAWETWQRNQAAEASMLFDQAVQAAGLNDLKTAKDAAGRIMENHSRSAYAAPAAWLAGHINYETGDIKSARAQYEYAWNMPGMTACARWPGCALPACCSSRRTFPAR